MTSKPLDINDSSESLIESYIERSRKTMFERIKSKSQERILEESRIEKLITKPNSKNTVSGSQTFSMESVVVIHVPPPNNALLTPL